MEKPDNSPIYKIAAAISNGDVAILSDVSECLLHTSSYAASAAQTIREESLHLRFFSVKL